MKMARASRSRATLLRFFPVRSSHISTHSAKMIRPDQGSRYRPYSRSTSMVTK
jgi:hypothetical protein